MCSDLMSVGREFGAGCQGRQAVTFLKKSNQKTFDSCGGWRDRRQIPHESKVFARFFQKALLPGCFLALS
jgi:hypothetical protein